MKKDVFVGSERHHIFFWVVPADVAGTWRWSLTAGNDQINPEMEITQQFNKVQASSCPELRRALR